MVLNYQAFIPCAIVPNLSSPSLLPALYLRLQSTCTGRNNGLCLGSFRNVNFGPFPRKNLVCHTMPLI
jgi:hypothetical protein